MPASTTSNEQPISVAIIGAGIVGLAVALGLLDRGISVTLYERASNYHEIGAGIGISPNAERAMKLLNPRIRDAFKSVAAQNDDDWIRAVDGYSHDKNDPLNDEEELIFKLYLGERGFEGCQRSALVEGMARHVPKSCVEFNKNLESISEHNGGTTMVCNFCDGTSAEADMVVGCDGIHSRVRQILLGIDNPAAYPHYSHKYALRGLIPMDKAKTVLSHGQPSNRLIHMGPDAHLVTLPIADNRILNTVCLIFDPDEWPHEKLSAPIAKSTVVKAFSKFGPGVRGLVSLLPEKLDAWAVFDTLDYPAPSYVKGRVCLVGDAAHASSPHHGAGAGSGIEDALALAEVLVAAAEAVGTSELERHKMIEKALQCYNDIRIERTQWLVESSRILGELYEWQNKETGRDPEKSKEEVRWRSHKIWDYDVEEMVRSVREDFRKAIA